MPLHRSCLPLAIAVILPGCSSNTSVPIEIDNSAFADFDNLDREQHLDLDLGHGVSVPATISVTTKGNGGLEVLNIMARVYDTHDDGTLIEGGRTSIRLVDVDGDGYRDLVTYGIRLDQPDNAVEVSRVPFAAVYIFDPTTRTFRAFSSDAYVTIHVTSAPPSTHSSGTPSPPRPAR